MISKEDKQWLANRYDDWQLIHIEFCNDYTIALYASKPFTMFSKYQYDIFMCGVNVFCDGSNPKCPFETPEEALEDAKDHCYEMYEDSSSSDEDDEEYEMDEEEFE